MHLAQQGAEQRTVVRGGVSRIAGGGAKQTRRDTSEPPGIIRRHTQGCRRWPVEGVQERRSTVGPPPGLSNREPQAQGVERQRSRWRDADGARGAVRTVERLSGPPRKRRRTAAATTRVVSSRRHSGSKDPCHAHVPTVARHRASLSKPRRGYRRPRRVDCRHSQGSLRRPRSTDPAAIRTPPKSQASCSKYRTPGAATHLQRGQRHHPHRHCRRWGQHTPPI